MGERQFCRSLLRIGMAQICQELGWNSIQSTPCDLMTDILQRYIQKLASISHQYAEHYGRTEPNLDDIGLTFQQLGVSLYELENYIKEVDPIPFKHDIPCFPLHRKNDLQHPEPGSREDRERLQYIPAYLPPIIGSDDFGAPIAHRDSISSVPGTPMETDSPESRHLMPSGGSHISPRGDKREIASPVFSEQAMKRLRLDGDGTPQELTAVTIGVSGELTPKRAGKLPIATTPPQRALKMPSDIPAYKATKALTDGVLSKSDETILDRLQPKSPKGGRTPTADQKSPKSQVPSKQKAQTKSPIHSMFSPHASTKYPFKSKSVSTPSSADARGGEFQFPPPKSPKLLSSSLHKKQQEKPHEHLTKKEKAALKVFEFDDEEFDSKPHGDPHSPESRPYKEPSAYHIPDEPSKGKTASSESISASIDAVISRSRDKVGSSSKIKKLDKERKKSISKEKGKIKPKLKTKKSKENIPSYDSLDSLDVKPAKVSKKKSTDSLDKKTPKLVIKTERQSSNDGEMKVMKKKFKKIKEKDKTKQLKVKKLKQKSIEYKMKSKAAKRGVSPTASRPQDDSSPEKRQPIQKFSLIKSAGSGSKLQFKISLPTSERKPTVDKEKSKKPDKFKKTSDAGKPKVKRLKASSSDLESSDKEKKSSSKRKTAVKEEGQKDSVKKEKDEKVVSTPIVPKITFKFGATPKGGDSPKVSIKTPSPPPVPKLSITMSSKKGKDSSKASSKIISSSKAETKLKKEDKIKSETKPKREIKMEVKSETKKKTETKTKTESKAKAEAKPKLSKKKERESEKDRELENENDKERKVKKEVKKEKPTKEVKEKERPAKNKEEVKAKAEISPYDFDAPTSPLPSPPVRIKKEPSTPLRREPTPGIFAPSVPSPSSQTSGKSSPASARASSKASAAPSVSSPAPQKSKQKASAPPPTPPPTKAALKALPPSATKATKGGKKEKEKASQKQKPVSPPPVKAEPPKTQPEEPCSLIMETVGTVINEHGEQIWYCPACRQPDDGVKPMVGCDECDDWYHWTCVGLSAEPDSDQWFCPKCRKKPKAKKKRGKKS